MTRTNRSLIYVAAYLIPAGVLLLLAPRLALRLLFSTGEYGETLPRLAGMLLIGLGVLVVQIIRYRLVALYPTTLAVRVFFCACFLAFYSMSGDPLFLVLFAVVIVGVIWTGVSFALDRRTATS